jgi:hypothetical protein
VLFDYALDQFLSCRRRAAPYSTLIRLLLILSDLKDLSHRTISGLVAQLEIEIPDF